VSAVAGTLTEKTRRILALIADGHSYAQIVDGQRDVSYLDIFHTNGAAAIGHPVTDL